MLKFFAILALVSLVVLPAQTASAAALTKVTISPEPQGALVAGYTYTARMETNKPQSTSWNSFIKYGPTRSGDQWNLASRKLFGYHSPQTNTLTFIVPENYPGPLVYIMVEGRFTPLTGDGLTQDTKVLGPFRVNYMKDITNLEAKANSDGTITLSWYNNTNMATHFEIVRVGPTSERTLIYYKPGANIGPMEFTDETTLEVEDETFIYFVKPILHDSFKRSLPDLQDNFKYVSRRVTAPKPPAFKLMPVIVPLGSFVLIGGDDESQPQEAPQDLINQLEDFRRRLGLDVFLGGPYGQGYPDAVALDPTFPAVDVIGVALDKTSLTLQVGESATLRATVSPGHATNKNVTWHTSNPLVATVNDSGRVTAQSGGTATITVITDDGGKTAEAVVIVEADEEGDDSEGVGQEGDAAQQDMQFNDIPAGHWATAEIAEAVSMGIIQGYPDGSFRPNGDVTRAEFATMLMRGIPVLPSTAPLTFTDSDTIGSWAVGHVQQAVARGIIQGYPDGTFRPNANITRAEMITMVVRAAGLAAVQGRQTSFADDAQIPDWAKGNVVAAQEAGFIFGGITDNRFAAGKNATRAESASSIIKMLKLR